MKNREKSHGCNMVAARMILPAIPFARRVGENQISISGVTTLPASFQTAKYAADARLRECRFRLSRGDRTAIIELLRDHPFFIRVDWVRVELLRLWKGGLLRPPRGRRRGSFTIHPLLIVGLVEELRATGEVQNREQAFSRLGCLSYDAAKAAYYQALHDSRFQAAAIELSGALGAEEASPSRLAAEVLQPAGEIRRTFSDRERGEIQIAFRSGANWRHPFNVRKAKGGTQKSKRRPNVTPEKDEIVDERRLTAENTELARQIRERVQAKRLN